MALTAQTLPWRPHRRGAGGLLRALRVAGAAALVCVGLLGALTRPGTAVFLATVLGGMTWTLVRHLHAGGRQGLPGLPHPAVAATWAVVTSAAVAGTATLGLPVVGFLGALLAGPLAVARWCAGPPQAPAARQDDAQPGMDEVALVELLRLLTVEELFCEWRDTARPWDRGTQEPPARIRVRCLLIAELGRRDPEGTRRWLLESPEAPPERYVTDRNERAA